MSVELHAEEGAARPVSAPETVLETGPRERERPHVSGDLPSVLHTGPMFRRAVAGYDRFQVDTYAQWAEDELATADREREHLLAVHVSTRAELDEARQLLSHSSGGGEFLRQSRRIGSMLAAAADEAETIRAEAENHRSVACAQAEVVTAGARAVLADAETEATRLLDAAAVEVADMTAEAGRIVAAAERTGRDARAEATARLESARQTEQHAAEAAEQIRLRARDDAQAARLQARQDIVRMLSTGREERRRADAEAAAIRERLDRDVAARRAVLLAEVAELEQRRDVLRAELESAPGAVVPSSGALHLQARAYLERIHDRLGRHVPPRRSAPGHSAPVAARGRGRTAA
ncbi:hypothetical protein FHU33_2244 [Blastococcus colisei]|uniref:DivIVA protein n=1 Tax=Blastococcus colisei TaxID=1564162 RepID=A0A543PFI8_9ACTN|nr:hypothetical protein [Blastococcus colisei]TQN42835.1 hypothetical protein FHU33_2244 [Blastococcus colisei]